jgi:hypothetical protein
MNPILVSKNKNYIIFENSVYSNITDKTYTIDELGIEGIINIFKENAIYLYKNGLMESQKLLGLHRKMTYQILENVDVDTKSKIMMEYETKFGNLLFEAHIIVEDSWLSSLYNWTIGGLIDRVKSYGTGAVQMAKDLFTGNWKGFFQDIRTIMFSPEAIAIETILSATGIGGIGPAIAWGIMGIYDTYLISTNDPNASWWFLIIDFFCSLPALAVLGKAFKTTLESAGILTKTAGKSMEEAITVAAENPKTVGLLSQIYNGIKNGLNSFINLMRKGAEWVGSKLKLTWAGKMVDAASQKIAKFLDFLGVKVSKDVSKKFATSKGVKGFQNAQARNVAGLKNAVKSGVQSGAIAGTVMGVTNSELGGSAIDYVGQKTGQLFGTNQQGLGQYKGVSSAFAKADVQGMIKGKEY